MKPSPLLFAASVAACAPSGPATDFNGETALSYVEEQVAFGPRIPNTEGHRRAGDWIVAQLRRTADSVIEDAFEHVTVAGDTLHLRNFIGLFRPQISERILLLAHWDSRPRSDRARNLGDRALPVPGANDGASGVALLLALADVLAATPPSLGVDLLFVDGEDYGDFSGPDVLLGSRHYAATVDPDHLPLFAVLFDMIGDADLSIPQETYSVNAAPEVVERVWTVARELGYQRVFIPRVGSALTDDHIPLIEAGVRAIDVIDFDYGPGNAYWHTPQDTPDKVSASSLQVVGDVALTLVR